MEKVLLPLATTGFLPIFDTFMSFNKMINLSGAIVVVVYSGRLSFSSVPTVRGSQK